MELGLLEYHELEEALSVIDKAFIHVMGEEDYNEFKKFHNPRKLLESVFDESQVYRPVFCAMRDNGKIIGVSGFARSLFADYVYEFRLASVLPEYMRKGINGAMRDYRIKLIKDALNGHRGLIIADVIHPKKYEENGWEYFGKFEDSNLMGYKV